MKIRLVRDSSYPRADSEEDYGAMDFYIWMYDTSYMEWRWIPRYGTTQQVWRWVERRVNVSARQILAAPDAGPGS